MLKCIVSVDYICKDDQYPLPWCKLVLKRRNMINEDKWECWTNEKMKHFLINDQFNTYLFPQYTFYGRISNFLTMTSSSSAVKPLPSRAYATHRLPRGCASPQPYTPPLKAPETRKKWAPLSKFFGCSLFYLRNIIYLWQIMRALLSNKNGIIHLW